MRKLLTILILFISFKSIAQPIVNRAGQANTVQDARLYAQYNFGLPRYADTTAANIQKGIDSLGTKVFTYDVMGEWIRTVDANGVKKWSQTSSGGSSSGNWLISGNGQNIVNTLNTGGLGTSNGATVSLITSGQIRVVLPVNGLQRQVTTGAFKYMLFDTTNKTWGYGDGSGGGGGSGTVTSVGTGYGLTGGPITTTGTIIFDSATVFSQIRTSITATNGLSKYGNAIGLGGTLGTSTTISGNTTNALSFPLMSQFRVQQSASSGYNFVMTSAKIGLASPDGLSTLDINNSGVTSFVAPTFTVFDANGTSARIRSNSSSAAIFSPDGNTSVSVANSGDTRLRGLNNISDQDVLLGRSSSVSGQVGYVTIGSGLSLSGGALSATTDTFAVYGQFLGNPYTGSAISASWINSGATISFPGSNMTLSGSGGSYVRGRVTTGSEDWSINMTFTLNTVPTDTAGVFVGRRSTGDSTLIFATLKRESSTTARFVLKQGKGMYGNTPLDSTGIITMTAGATYRVNFSGGNTYYNVLFIRDSSGYNAETTALQFKVQPVPGVISTAIYLQNSGYPVIGATGSSGVYNVTRFSEDHFSPLNPQVTFFGTSYTYRYNTQSVSEHFIPLVMEGTGMRYACFGAQGDNLATMLTRIGEILTTNGRYVVIDAAPNDNAGTIRASLVPIIDSIQAHGKIPIVLTIHQQDIGKDSVLKNVTNEQGVLWINPGRYATVNDFVGSHPIAQYEAVIANALRLQAPFLVNKTGGSETHSIIGSVDYNPTNQTAQPLNYVPYFNNTTRKFGPALSGTTQQMAYVSTEGIGIGTTASGIPLDISENNGIGSSTGSGIKITNLGAAGTLKYAQIVVKGTGGELADWPNALVMVNTANGPIVLCSYTNDSTVIQGSVGARTGMFNSTGLKLPSSRYLNFGFTSGSGGYGIRDNSGTMEFKNLSGSWASIGVGTITGVTTFGSTPNANGLSVSGANILMQPADGSNPGGISTTTQSFAGAKTFTASTLTLDNSGSPALYVNSNGTSQTRALAFGRSGLYTLLFMTDNYDFHLNTAGHTPTVDDPFVVRQSNNSIGIGNIAPTAKLDVRATTEQLRVGYDASNYWNATTGSSGSTVFDAVGSGARFTLNDSLTFAGIGAQHNADDSMMVWRASSKTVGYRAIPSGSSLTATQIGFGSGANALTGSSDFIYNTSSGIFNVAFSGMPYFNIDDGNNKTIWGEGAGGMTGTAIEVDWENALVKINNDANNVMLGINTSSPAVALDVVGDTKLTGAFNGGLNGTYTVSGLIGANPSGLTAFIGDAEGEGNNTALVVDDGGQAFHFFNSAATVTIDNLSGTGSRAVLANASGLLSAPISDRTTKYGIEPLEDGLSKVMQLKPSTFFYKKKFQNFGSGQQVGFIAQDIQEILPNSVYRNNSNGKMGYNEIDLVPLMVSAIQSQQKQIEELKALISQLIKDKK